MSYMSYILYINCISLHMPIFSEKNMKTFTMKLKTGSKSNLFCIFPKNTGGGMHICVASIKWNYRNQGVQKFYSRL